MEIEVCHQGDVSGENKMDTENEVAKRIEELLALVQHPRSRSTGKTTALAEVAKRSEALFVVASFDHARQLKDTEAECVSFQKALTSTSPVVIDHFLYESLLRLATVKIRKQEEELSGVRHHYEDALMHKQWRINELETQLEAARENSIRLPRWLQKLKRKVARLGR